MKTELRGIWLGVLISEYVIMSLEGIIDADIMFGYLVSIV